MKTFWKLVFSTTLLSNEILFSPIAAAITIIDTPIPITYEIFIKQRYNWKLNSDRILALPTEFTHIKKINLTLGIVENIKDKW